MNQEQKKIINVKSICKHRINKLRKNAVEWLIVLENKTVIKVPLGLERKFLKKVSSLIRKRETNKIIQFNTPIILSYLYK